MGYVVGVCWAAGSAEPRPRSQPTSDCCMHARTLLLSEEMVSLAVPSVDTTSPSTMMLVHTGGEVPGSDSSCSTNAQGVGSRMAFVGEPGRPREQGSDKGCWAGVSRDQVPGTALLVCWWGCTPAVGPATHREEANVRAVDALRVCHSQLHRGLARDVCSRVRPRNTACVSANGGAGPRVARRHDGGPTATPATWRHIIGTQVQAAGVWTAEHGYAVRAGP